MLGHEEEGNAGNGMRNERGYKANGFSSFNCCGLFWGWWWIRV